MDFLQVLVYIVILIIAILSSVLAKKKGEDIPDDEEEIIFEESSKQNEQEKIESRHSEQQIQRQQELQIQKGDEVRKQQVRVESAGDDLIGKLKKIEEIRKGILSEKQDTLSKIYKPLSSGNKIVFDEDTILKIIIGSIILGKPKFLNLKFNVQKPVSK